MSRHLDIHFDPAREMELAVYGTFGRVHMKSDGVIDPIADRVMFKSPVRHCRGKGKRGRIESGQVHVKIDGAEIAGGHRRKRVALTGGVGAREIDTQMVAKHEAGDGVIEVRLGSETESNYNCSIWL